MSRAKALIIGTGMTLATLAPALSRAPFADDSYPLSTYPMFARSLQKREIVFADGVANDASERRLGPEFVANDEPMQAQRTLRLAARSGRQALRTLCGRIAERVARTGDLSRISRVRIVRGTFDAVKYFEQGSAPEAREVLTECRVRRRKMKERWLTWWNPAAPALRLAVLRGLVGAFALIYLLIRAPSLVSVAQFHVNEFRPVGLARVLSSPLPPLFVYAGVVLASVTGVLFVLGVRFRWTGPAFAAAFLWVTTYRSSWAMIFHTDNLVALHLVALASSPAADALSWDARRTDAAAWQQPNERYGGAIRIMAVVTACAYVVAGVAKLKLAGTAWLGGELLRQQIAFDNLRKIELGSSYSRLGVWLVRHPSVFAPLAVATMFVELGAPAALANRRVALGWSIVAWCFHVGVAAMMNIGFPYQLSFVAYLPLFRVERLLELGPVRRLATQLGAVNKPSTPV